MSYVDVRRRRARDFITRIKQLHRTDPERHARTRNVDKQFRTHASIVIIYFFNDPTSIGSTRKMTIINLNLNVHT